MTCNSKLCTVLKKTKTCCLENVILSPYSTSASPFAWLWCSHFLEIHGACAFSLCCLFPSNSITSQQCVPPGISPAPLAHRQTPESVGSLTQHKLHCEAEVSESLGCISPDRGAMAILKLFITSHFKG